VAAAEGSWDTGESGGLAPVMREAPVGMATFGKDLRCLAANDAFAQLLGHPPAAVVGATLASLAGEPAGPAWPRLVERVDEMLRLGQPGTEAELRVRGTDGRERSLLATWFMASAGPGGLPTAGVVLVDVSRRLSGGEDRHTALQRLTAAFSAAVTPEAVADVVIRAVCDAVEATGGAVYLVDEAGGRLTAIRSGYPWPPGNLFHSVTVADDLPVSFAVREHEAVWLDDENDLRARFPRSLERSDSGESWGGHAALPLELGGETLGAMVFSWTDRRRFATDEQRFLEAVASNCAQALQRAALFQRERAARHHTERLADQVLRLERITGALASASEPDEVVDRFLDQCLPDLGANYGAVLEVDPRQGALVPLGVRSTSAWDPRPVLLDGSGPLAQAARSHQSVMLEDRGQIVAMVGDSIAPLSQEQAWAAIPLVAYGELLGVAAIRYDGARQFDADDRAFLDRVGRRLAEALERSRLYAHQRDAREQAEAAARWLRSVQSLAAALARSATRRDVARALREHLQPATRADYSVVAALGADRRSLDVLTGRSSFAVPTEQIGESVRGAVRDSIMRGRGIELEDATAIAAMFPGLAGSGIASFALLPIRAGRRVIGVIGMGWSTPGALTSDVRRLLAIAVSLGGAAFERAAAYDLDHHIAETLQRHLLTEPVLTLPGLSWAARYAPGNVELTAGGDWYDIIELPNGRVALVVGDIVGHGIVAAAAMGQLRSATRALAVREDPAGVLEALDAYVSTTGQGHLSSMAYVVLDPATRTAEYAIAGHPPPLQRAPDGSTVFVEEAHGPLLGIAEAGSRRSVVRSVEPGSTFVLYTDGLIERRGECIDDGMARLAGIARDAEQALHPEALFDRLLEQLDVGGGAPDDITLLVLRFEPVTGHREQTFPARLEMLRVIRTELRSWLEANDLDASAISDIVLACDEACAHAVEHGASSGGSDTIDLTLSADERGVVLSITDSGPYVESGAVEEDLPGVQIMYALMHDVQMSSGERGTTVTMTRQRSARRALTHPVDASG
jgi:GAF domain-containing protein/anti-sigma regulatory factor (Ser/Thr protein kinase)